MTAVLLFSLPASPTPDFSRPVLSVNKAGNTYVSHTFREIMNKISVYLVLYDNFYYHDPQKKSYSIPIRRKIIAALRKGNLKAAQRLLQELGRRVIAAYDMSPALQNSAQQE